MWIKALVLVAITIGSTAVYGSNGRGENSETTNSSSGRSDTADSASQKGPCKEKWKAYRESQACFAPYRLTNGGVKDEAYAHCKEVQQPEFCE